MEVVNVIHAAWRWPGVQHCYFCRIGLDPLGRPYVTQKGHPAVEKLTFTGALHSPKGIKLNWYKPLCVQKVVLSRSPSATATC